MADCAGQTVLRQKHLNSGVHRLTERGNIGVNVLVFDRIQIIAQTFWAELRYEV